MGTNFYSSLQCLTSAFFRSRHGCKNFMLFPKLREKNDPSRNMTIGSSEFFRILLCKYVKVTASHFQCDCALLTGCNGLVDRRTLGILFGIIFFLVSRCLFIDILVVARFFCIDIFHFHDSQHYRCFQLVDMKIVNEKLEKSLTLKFHFKYRYNNLRIPKFNSISQSHRFHWLLLLTRVKFKVAY